MPSKKTAWAVKSGTRTVSIGKLANGRLSVTWLCGSSRTFSADDLEAVIWRLERLHEADSYQWINERDSPGYTFQLILHGGRLYVADGAAATTRPDLDAERDSVKWGGRSGFKQTAEVAIRAARPLKQRAKKALTTA